MDLRTCAHVVCIEKRNPDSPITPGKIYPVLSADTMEVTIVNDRGKRDSYYVERFRPAPALINFQEPDPWQSH